MSSLTNIEKLKLEKIFQSPSGAGYILDFSNRTFSEFFLTSIQKDIYEQKYNFWGESKANRLRAFWEVEPDHVVGKLLQEMLEYWKTKKLLRDETITHNEQQIYDECLGITGRLLGKKPQVTLSEDDFIQKDFQNISLAKINLDQGISPVLEQRLGEIRKCLNAKAHLSVIFLCGSTLEGILLGIASSQPKRFNECVASPKDKEGKVRQFYDWTLSNFIDVSYSLGMLGEDVKKFSHALRDFRNYIHPYQQMASKFNPDEHTAKICWQVLQAVIAQLSTNKSAV